MGAKSTSLDDIALLVQASNGKIQGISKFALIEVTSAVINTDDGRHPQSQALQETLMVNESEAVELKLPTSAFALPARRFDIDYRKIGENSIKNGKLAPVRVYPTCFYLSKTTGHLDQGPSVMQV